MTREKLLELFLEQTGWNTAERIPLASDASFRTYERLVKNENSVILMNSPLSENPDKFVFIDNLLRKAGVHAPKILKQDLENGFLLLEDFGDNTFSKLLTNGSDEYELYKIGIDTLIQLQKNIRLPESGINEYNMERLMREVMLLPNWFGKYAVPNGLNDQAIGEFTQIWTTLNQQLVTLPQTIVLLDYHADNLMLTQDGSCGVLDFQDARIGPATYDLMTLLEDERRDVNREVRDSLIEHFFTELPNLDTAKIRQTLPIVAMQRHTKVIGIFLRLFMRDKKDKYLKMIPLVWELTERHFNNPIFTEYKNWVEKYIPKEVRHRILTEKDLEK